MAGGCEQVIESGVILLEAETVQWVVQRKHNGDCEATGPKLLGAAVLQRAEKQRPTVKTLAVIICFHLTTHPRVPLYVCLWASPSPGTHRHPASIEAGTMEASWSGREF